MLQGQVVAKKSDKMTKKELDSLLEFWGFSNQEFADLLGVTRPAVDHWVTGRREVPPTTVRLLRLFYAQPKVMKDFQEMAG